MYFVDSHCHLHFERITRFLPKILNESTSHGINHFVVNSTSPRDFELVLNFCNKYNNAIPCFGIHPYYIDKLLIDDSLNSLYKICNDMKKQYCVGEIGMDKTRIKECPMDLQEQVFRKQIQFAISKSVVFCVHCVKCIGLVYDVLKSELSSPYPFLMHGFSGSADYVDRFVKLGSYFSISNYLFNLSPNRRKAMEETIRKIPLDRLLFESDAPDMINKGDISDKTDKDELGNYVNSPKCIENICKEVARIKKISKEELSTIVYQNTMSFFHITND